MSPFLSIAGARRAALLTALVLPLAALPLAIAPALADLVSDPAPPAGVPDAGASAPLLSVAASPDGTLIYSLDVRGELLARDAKSGAVRFRGLTDALLPKLRVLSDGSLLVGSSSGVVTHYEKPVGGAPLKLRRVFNQETATNLSVNQLPGNARSLRPVANFSVSPDGGTLAVVSLKAKPLAGEGRSTPTVAFSAQIGFWNLSDGAQLSQATPAGTVGLTGPQLAWSDEKTLAIAFPAVSIQRFDSATGQLQSEWKPPTDAAPKPDLAAEEAESNRRLEMLPPALQERARAAAERRRANPVVAPLNFGTVQAISDDGTQLLAATRLGFQIWNTKDNSVRLLEKSVRLGNGDGAKFSPDGTLVAVWSNGTFYLWKSDGTQVGLTRVNFANFSDLAFTPDSKTLILSDDAGVARLWNTSGPLSREANVVLPGYFEPWTQISAGGNLFLAATERGVAKIDASGKPQWFEMAPIEAPAALPDYAKTQTRVGIVGLAAAPDGKSWSESVSYEGYTATFQNMEIPRGELRVRDAATGQVTWRVADKNPASTVPLLRFLPDGTLLTGKGGAGGISAGPINQEMAGLQARDAKTGAPKQLGITWGDEVGTRETGNIQILEPSADGKRLLLSSGSGSEGIQIIDLESKKVVTSFGANSQIDRGPWALSPDGRWLAANWRGALALWDLNLPRQNSQITPTVRLPLDVPIGALRFGRDGALAVGLSDGRVWLFGPEMAPAMKPQWETAANRAISSLTFSSDGKALWIGDERGDLRSRDAATGQLQSTLRLMAPKNEGEMPSWVRWARSGTLEKSAP